MGERQHLVHFTQSKCHTVLQIDAQPHDTGVPNTARGDATADWNAQRAHTTDVAQLLPSHACLALRIGRPTSAGECAWKDPAASGSSTKDKCQQQTPK